MFGLVGETGCGKTVTDLTILRLLPDNARILAGTILFKNENLLSKTENEMREIRGSGISMISKTRRLLSTQSSRWRTSCFGS